MESERRTPGKIASFLRKRPEPIVFLAYGLVTAFMTYPTVTLTGRTYGEAGDPYLYIWWTWWFKYSFVNHLPVSPIPLVAVPFEYPWNPNLIEPATNQSLRGLSIVTNETVAYNLFLLFSFLAAAVAVYYLVRHLTGSVPAAAVCGFIFAFSPYMLAQGKEHINQVNTMWIPVFLLFTLLAWKKRTLLWCVLCGLSLVVMALFNPQYAFMCVVFFAVFVITIWLFGRPWRSMKTPLSISPLGGRGNRETPLSGERGDKRDLRLLVRAAPVALAVVTVLILLSFAAGGEPRGQAKEIPVVNKYSARPWAYILPHAEGRMLGFATRGFIRDHLHGGFIVESTLFLGFVPLLLAAYGFAFACRKKEGEMETEGIVEESEVRGGTAKQGGATTTTGRFEAPDSRDSRKVIWALVACAAVCFVLSLPPTFHIGNRKLYLPSYIVHLVAPQMRVYARFGVLVMLSVTLLAGYGIAELLNRYSVSRLRSIILCAAIAVLVLLEFSIVPPFHSLNTADTTDYYEYLGRKPGEATAAVYPMFFTDDFDNYGYFFEQRHHRKDLINGARPDGEGERYRQVVLDAWHPMTPGILKKMGAEYVLVLPGLYEEGNHLNYAFPVDAEDIEAPEGLVLEKRFGDCLFYRIDAPPARFVPLFGKGTTQAYVDRSGRAWHPGGGNVLIDVTSSEDEPVTCNINFKARSPGDKGKLTVVYNGADAGTSPLYTSTHQYSLYGVVLNPGRNYLELRSDVSPSALLGVPGYHEVAASVLVSNVTVEEVP